MIDRCGHFKHTGAVTLHILFHRLPFIHMRMLQFGNASSREKCRIPKFNFGEI